MAFSLPLARQIHHQIKKELTPLIQLVVPKLSDIKQTHTNNLLQSHFSSLYDLPIIFQNLDDIYKNHNPHYWGYICHLMPSLPPCLGKHP